MGLKVPPGLIKRGEFWHLQKTIWGQRIRESTGTGNLAEAERYLAHRIEEVRNARVYGVRPKRIFREAATKYLNEATKTSIADDALQLKLLDPYIGDLFLENIHMGTLQPFIEARKAKSARKYGEGGVKVRSINFGLQTVRHILNLAASEWFDETGTTWLAAAPRIKFLPDTDKRSPYPLTWDEQTKLFKELPKHLARMALFKVNTGCREAEVCGLRWEWEQRFLGMSTSIFLIPSHKVKNREPRVVVLNRVARAVIEQVRGAHPEYVFTYRGKPIRKMNGPAWRKARERAKIPEARVHDLKHTFGRRLRAAGVSFEDRQDLLGHKSGKITTHYSKAELENLIVAANRVCPEEGHNIDTMVIIREKSRHLSAVI